MIPDHKLFLVPCKTEEEAAFVCGCLNSSVASYIVRSYALSTGISTHVLERIPMPEFDAADAKHRAVVDAANACYQAARQGRENEQFAEDLNHACGRAMGLKTSQTQAITKSLEELP